MDRAVRLRCSPRYAGRTARPRSSGSRRSRHPPLGPGQVRVQVHAAAVNFPDVLLIANEYQVKVPTPFVPGSEFAGVVDGGGRGRQSSRGGRSRLRDGDRRRLRRGDRWRPPRPSAASPTGWTTSWRPPSASRTAPPTTCCGRWPPCSRARSSSCSAPAAAWAWPRCSSASVLGASVTAVASSAAKLEVAASYGATRLIYHRSGDLRQALREALPDGADVVVDPVGGDLAEPALRAMRWGGRFVTVGYASGAIPRIPLNLVLLKGVHLIGFQLRDFAAHAPDELRRNEQELLDMLIAHRARAAHRRHVRPHRDGRGPAARRRRQGHRQGRPVRQPDDQPGRRGATTRTTDRSA